MFLTVFSTYFHTENTVRNIPKPPECAEAFLKFEFGWQFGPQNHFEMGHPVQKNKNKLRISYKKGLFIE